MEIVLAIVVVGAVIFFGALISAGNERQRKAIDNLCEQTVLWARQDLRLKRERLARDVQVDHPLEWLNKVVSKVCGIDLNLQVVEAFENPRALLCVTGDGNQKLVLTPHSPADIRAMKRERRNRLSRYADKNPLLALPRNVQSFECSVLNNTITFDLELRLAWKGLTGNEPGDMDNLWMYMAA